MPGYRRGAAPLARLLLLFVLAASGLLSWIYRGHDWTWTPNKPLAHAIESPTPVQPHIISKDSSLSSKPAEGSPTSAIDNQRASGIDIDRPAGLEIKFKVRSRVGKVSSLYYDQVTAASQAYERALSSHINHDQRFGYNHLVLRRGIVEGLWTKHALILHCLVAELAKSQAERLDWLFWHDADVVIVNNQMPLEAFLPPEPRWSHINFIVSNDLGGLNDGVFFLRVCEWSVNLFAAALSYPVYNPDVDLPYGEQTALELLIQKEDWANNTMHVPQRWFNAYHNFGRDDDIPPEWNWVNGYQEPGDLLVHLPGTGEYRSQLIDEWLGKIRDEHEKYCLPLGKTTYPGEVKTFWENEAETETQRQAEFWRRHKLLQDIGRPNDDETRAEIEDAEKNGISADDIKEKQKQAKITALRDAEAALLGR